MCVMKGKESKGNGVESVILAGQLAVMKMAEGSDRYCFTQHIVQGTNVFYFDHHLGIRMRGSKRDRVRMRVRLRVIRCSSPPLLLCFSIISRLPPIHFFSFPFLYSSTIPSQFIQFSSILSLSLSHVKYKITLTYPPAHSVHSV
jgi:hypothetical protein